MKSENKENNDKQTGVQPSLEISGSRRKLIRGGAIGVPVVLALKSTPVLACNCKLPSGFSTSGNLSRNGGATCADHAHDVAYWQSHYDKGTKKFTGTTVLTTATFKSIFGGTDSRTLLAVLSSGTNLASLVVAAYLGIKANYFVSGISTTSIISMWQGSYRPTATAPLWSNTDSENYLRYVMGLPLL